MRTAFPIHQAQEASIEIIHLVNDALNQMLYSS